jgi:hypothetical protein
MSGAAPLELRIITPESTLPFQINLPAVPVTVYVDAIAKSGRWKGFKTTEPKTVMGQYAVHYLAVDESGATPKYWVAADLPRHTLSSKMSDVHERNHSGTYTRKVYTGTQDSLLEIGVRNVEFLRDGGSELMFLTDGSGFWIPQDNTHGGPQFPPLFVPAGSKYPSLREEFETLPSGVIALKGLYDRRNFPITE